MVEMIWVNVVPRPEIKTSRPLLGLVKISASMGVPSLGEASW